jgi:PPP family 3-phenylpropionic acid transporter
VGALWAVGLAAEIVFFWQQGRWFRRLHSERWLQVAAGATALRFAIVAAFASSPVWLVLAQLSHVFTFAAHHAACIDLVHRYFPGRLRGRGQALYTILGYGISGVLGGVSGGWLIDHLGYAAAFWGAAAMALVALGCAWQAQRAGPAKPAKRAQPAQPQTGVNPKEPRSPVAPSEGPGGENQSRP